MASTNRQQAKGIEIADYRAEFKTGFRQLNEEWISKHFTMEASDYKALDDPEGYILAGGGHIVVALRNQEVVAVCALIRMADPEFDFELAKMAVSPAARGQGIGEMLARAVIDRARSTGAKKIYLESNTVLAPAIKLYEKLGFRRISGKPTPYQRCNIQMELTL